MIVLKTADKKTRLMRVIAPPGVLLPSGLGLKVDNAEIGRAGFVRCVPNGCVAEVVMDDNLIGKLRTGQSATFIIFQTPEEGIGFPISLKGSARALTSCPEHSYPHHGRACSGRLNPGQCSAMMSGWPGRPA